MMSLKNLPKSYILSKLPITVTLSLSPSPYHFSLYLPSTLDTLSLCLILTIAMDPQLLSSVPGFALILPTTPKTNTVIFNHRICSFAGKTTKNK